MNALRNLVKGKPNEPIPSTQQQQAPTAQPIPIQQAPSTTVQPSTTQQAPPSPLKSSLGSSQGSTTENEEIILKDGEVPVEDRKRIFSKLTGLVGKDIVSLLSLPVSLFEPTSVLQTMIEPLRFNDLLFKISATEDPIERICLVAAFCISFLCYYVRTMKPFNPVLGETYEYVPPSKAYKSFCEQVSHHPPIGIAHTTCDEWTLSQESHIATKFWGTSVDVQSIGDNHLLLHKLNDHYTWKAPNACIHNILFGKIFVDYSGQIPIKSMSGGETATVVFKKAGWFGGSNCEISGEARNKDGALRAVFTGKWNEFIAVAKVDENGAKGPFVEMWRKPTVDNVLTHKFKFDPFIEKLTDLTDEMEHTLPPTDSRMRTDLRALSQNDVKRAGREKVIIEERERRKRREREAQGKKWSPVYFKKVPDDQFEYRWEFVGNYWDERSQRQQQHKEKQKLTDDKKEVMPKTILDDVSDPPVTTIEPSVVSA